MAATKGVLLIYTGGTIGSMPKDPSDEASPQIVVGWDEFKKNTPSLDQNQLGYRVDFEKTSELLDSCNIGPKIWTEIANIISTNYNDYEGFVILHGTDTMVYTATALSFMLANLAKPVILTGAQRTHLFQIRNDGLQNMITAISLANPKATGIAAIPEVMILFGQDLLRGNRTRKRDANGYAAYESPKYPPLARIGASIVVDEGRILPPPDGAFFLRSNLERDVIDFNVFPGVVETKIADLLLDGTKFKPKGVVVRAYGAGNIPTDVNFLKRIEASAKSGVVFYNVTQCTHGRVELGLYETSNLLLGIGMVSGTDLTPEAALVKMMIALGDEDLAGNSVALRNFLQQSQAGEQSTSIQEVPYPPKSGSISGGTPRFRFAPDRELSGTWDAEKLESATLRLFGAEIIADHPINIDIFAGVSSNEPLPDENSPSFVGVARRAPTNDKTILAFDVSAATRRLFKPGSRASYTIASRGEEGMLTWERAELALFIKDA
jgi:L-asparaginase